MKNLLAIACVAAGVLGCGTAKAQAAQPVNSLPAIAHINETVVVVHRRHHYRHWRHHHRRYYWRHHRRYYY